MPEGGMRKCICTVYNYVHIFIQIRLCCSHWSHRIIRLINCLKHFFVCAHIWKSLHEWKKDAMQTHVPKARVKAVKCVNAKNCKYIHLSVRELASAWDWPWVYTEHISPQWVCVCALPLLTDRSHWQSRWRLQPCDPRTGLRTDTAQASDQTGASLVRQPGSWCVCVNVYGICLYVHSKSCACSPPSRVSGYGGGQ